MMNTRNAAKGRWLDRTRQRWKARAVYLISAIQVSALVAAFVVVPARRITTFWVLAGTVIPFWALVLSIRCRVCGEHVMLWAWKRPNTIGDLNRLEACPQCGARDDRGEFLTGDSPAPDPRTPHVDTLFEHARRSGRSAWIVYVAIAAGGLWLLTWLVDLLR